MGEIGVANETALYGLRMWQMQAVIDGYRRRERGAWRRTRWQSWLMLCAMGAKGLHSPEDLLELPDDEEMAAEEEVTDEEYAAALELIRKANGG